MTPPYLTGALPAPHGFFTRQGGVSTARFARLNCSLNGRDDLALALENRARAARALGFSPCALMGLVQVHGTDVAIAPWTEADRPKADALVTATPGLLLGIVTADCAPVLFSAPGVVGAAHAGWRGALLGVLEATLDAMVAHGADPTRIAASIGPCIHQPSYEVSADLRDPVLAEDPAAARFFAPGRADRWWFDLPGYCAARLARRGIAAEILPHDTLADPDRFFSYRRASLAADLPVGHQISCIGLAP